MDLNERLKKAMQKDVQEMDAIYAAVAAGASPAEACSQIVGGSFTLSEVAAEAIIAGKGAQGMNKVVFVSPLLKGQAEIKNFIKTLVTEKKGA